MMKPRHPFHLVTPSPWPLTGSASVMLLMLGVAGGMHGVPSKGAIFTGVAGLALSVAQWWRDVVRESTFQGFHTRKVHSSHSWGMLLFIVSEVMFFASFFWAFFHSSLCPCPEVGAVWPPSGVTPFNPFHIPLLNTAVLLASGATVTWAHHGLMSREHSEANLSLGATIFLGVYFTSLQALEYYEAPFTIADSVYGSTFFLATGFHGLHVLVGSSFLSVCAGRLRRAHFSTEHHFGFEAAVWYWHFVDVVWLFLFVSIYWWGSGG